MSSLDFFGRYVDWGSIVGIEGNDPTFAVAEVVFHGIEPEKVIPIPVREMGILGELTIGSSVRAEVSGVEPHNPRVIGISYLTDEDIDSLQIN